MGERAAQEGNLLQAGQLDVVDIAADAAQEPGVLLAQDARTDALAVPVRIDHGAPDPLCDGLDRPAVVYRELKIRCGTSVKGAALRGKLPLACSLPLVGEGWGGEWS